MKITITRLLETAKYLATDAGDQLKEMITQVADFMDQGVRALRNGLTFRDNFDCLPRTISLKEGVPTVIAVGKPVTGAIVTRTLSTSHALASFLMFYDSGSRLNLKATFLPAATDSVDLEVIFLY